MICSIGCEYQFNTEDTNADLLKLITPEEIDSIFAAISQEESLKYPTETDDNGALIVYWLDGGSVWHMSQFCATIKNADSDKVRYGSVNDAICNKKGRACKVCGEDMDEYLPESDLLTKGDAASSVLPCTENDESSLEHLVDGEVVVFWLENSKVWHISKSCSSLSKSDPNKIIEGSVSDAISAGKERVCKICSN